MIHKAPDISRFFVAGINYKKTDAAIRGQFAINQEQYGKILELAPAQGLKELFILSTCNRTEIFGFAEDAGQLIGLLCTQTAGHSETFRELSYLKSGFAAIQHLFEVAAGLDSQILGDYEIVGQLKQAAKFARQRNFIGPFLERLVNAALQSSKTIKNQTGLSGGTVSVSFAAIQYIREQVLKGRRSSIADQKILLIGVGKMGRNTCRNLVDYLGAKDITLINRTEEKAVILAEEVGVNYAPLEKMDEQIAAADIIIVSTNADHSTLLSSQLTGSGEKLVIDLSIPFNVEKSAAALPGITLVNVDELSRLKDETLQKREAEVPRAKEIIAGHFAEFMEWHEMRKHVPVLKAVKTKLQELHHCRLFAGITASREGASLAACSDQQIQRVINGMAAKLRQHNQRGCHYIEAINEYIATGTD
ncbi:MAG: glutamyl-tRNA reductase [Bacteroidota bacterium]|nr:glutamyl-tRNA reductase [Bacteroidota bacterium]MDP4218694.1 glutamyl-tRNA reductase [Bacteroidota bacterium]MDP4247809.1 glutamyl-tRNA reductase [Bacteroidota bacterium]MDP4253773.1 glutamyl-tRNA reductase [Bacteroidota bacterium]MDP4258323.1 glutamyl-tRNA reductase [Bacteroidota bacterium]